MPFPEGHDNGKRFSSDRQPEKNGRPKGVKNRATIARKILEMNIQLPDEAFEKLKRIYPKIKQKISTEEIMTIIQAANAITKGDTNAYKAIMDSRYGAPKQDVQENITGGISLRVGYARNNDTEEGSE